MSIHLINIQFKHEKISAVRRTHVFIEYLVSFKDKFPNKIVTAWIAVQNWPLLVLEFLENQLNMTAAPISNGRVRFAVTEATRNLIGDPISVSCKP